MNKLITYFKQGKGRGLRAMLFFSILVGISLWGVIYTPLKNIPQNKALNQFIDQLPTIVLEEGVVVEPADTNASYTFNGQPIFFIQTDREDVAPLSATGIYLTRTNIAFVSDSHVQQISSLTGSTIITHDTIIGIIRSIVNWTPVILALVYFLVLWLSYLIVVGVSSLIVKACRFKLSKGAIWRSATFSTICVFLLNVAMGFKGYGLSSFVGMVLASIFFSYPIVPSPLFTPQRVIFSQEFISILLILLIAFGIREKKEVEKEIKKKEKKK